MAIVPPSLQAEDPVDGTMEEFRNSIRIISKGVAKVLRSRNEDSITVGSFSGPPNLGAAAGAGLKQLFTEELKLLNIRVAKLGTPLGLSGEYRLTRRNPQAETRQVELEVKLTDDSGQAVADLASLLELPEWQQDIVRKDGKDKRKTFIDTTTSPETTALAMGLTYDFDVLYQRRYGADGNGFNPERVDIIKEAIESPTAAISNGNELRSSKTSPYAIQLLVAGVPREIKMEDKRPFVQIDKGETFKVRIINQSTINVSSTLTLDGINSFTFSEIRKADGKPKYRQWIIPPKQTFDVAGWHVNNSTAKEFKVTDFSESAAALVSSDGQIGTISVVVRATWKKNEPEPPGEVAQPGSGDPTFGAIGFGENVDQSVKEDAQQREYGRVRSIMTIRYEKP